jgi:hypothetical protein
MASSFNKICHQWVQGKGRQPPKAVIVPDRRCRILEVVIVRRLITWVLGIWRGEGLGKGLRKGRSVYKQPETEVDGSCHSKEGSK